MSQLATHIHLLGIGGAGMSAIARVLLGYGYRLSGSDRQESSTTAALANLGATIFVGHRAEQIEGVDLVIRSSAVPDDNIEVVAAREQGIPVLKRADFLGDLMDPLTGIAVTGTHGKTTTTGMIAHILLRLRLDPTVIVGGTLTLLRGNGHAGSGRHFVIEADEYDHMFLGLKPKIGVITNAEHDHPDIYPTPASYMDAFRAFVDLLPDCGRLVACTDDPGARQLLEDAAGRLACVAYGLDSKLSLPDGVERLIGRALRPNDLGGTDFIVEQNNMVLGPVRLQIPGRHNVQNALAAIATALGEGIGFKQISYALASFKGMGRRFELKGEAQGITIIDDYAHHPTEIQATLQAARSRYPDRRVWAVWQPHTFSRTHLFLDQFRHSFSDADQVIMLDIYRSREKETLGLVPAEIARTIAHPNVSFAADHEAAMALLQEHMTHGDVIITMNAGDASQIGDRLLARLGHVAPSDESLEAIEQTESIHSQLAQEKIMSEPKKEPSGQAGQDKKQPVAVDATADQVRRLVNKLKNKQQTNTK